MGLFGDLKGKKSGYNSNYLTPGTYKIKINRCKSGRTGDHNGNKEFFAVEGEVLESSGEEALEAGAKCDWFVDLSRYRDSGLGEIADFARHGLHAYATQVAGADPGCSPDDIDPSDDMDAICGEENSLAGVVLTAFATRKDGKKFVRTSWALPED